MFKRKIFVCNLFLLVSGIINSIGKCGIGFALSQERIFGGNALHFYRAPNECTLIQS